jgi:TfoX/Sxy family transcriptional regulator of competence genes
MAFDEDVADRVRAALSQRRIHFMEKRMMGGLCFMVADKMCVGIAGDQLMVRLDPDVYQESLQRQGCKPMDFTGRPMKGFVFVELCGLSTKRQLQHWVDLALEFNPKAKSSKKAKPTSLSKTKTASPKHPPRRKRQEP